MTPLIAIVGRPDVGKSTLFNCLTRRHRALVADLAGVTRDRRYGGGHIGDRRYLVVDTGGLGEEDSLIGELVGAQTAIAVDEADALLFIVDARAGITTADQKIAEQLRRSGKPVVVAANKTDGLHEPSAVAEFYALGFVAVLPLSAVHRRGLQALMRCILERLPQSDVSVLQDSAALPLISIAGRPNVGKSTLVNQLVGADRVITSDVPGTTRDSIYVLCERNGCRYTLIDTAGVRRQGRINTEIERMSAASSVRAITESNVAVIVIDAKDGISEQDVTLLGIAIEHGRALIIALNKWDVLSNEQRQQVQGELRRRTKFASYVSVCPISALHGWGLSRLLRAADIAYSAAQRKLPTPALTRALAQAIEQVPPPQPKRHSIKLRYAHQGGSNPPLIVIHGNQTESVPDHYRRYLMACFRRHFQLRSTPVVIDFRNSDNPYQGRRNLLTPRQQRKRQRLIRHAR